MRSLIILFLCVATNCLGQIPRTLTIQVYLEQASAPLTGRHTLSMRWYPVPIGSTPVFSEDLDADVVDGLATLVAGSSLPLPTDLLRSGPLWLGFSIDGGAELLPRTVLTSVPYALMAERALLAEALAPEVTGVVTSINEIAGAVELKAGAGIRVDRDGQLLVVSKTDALLRGRVDAIGGVYRYQITTGVPLPTPSVICAAVHADSFVGVTAMDVDVATGQFTLVTSAPLLSGEWIDWSIP